MAGVLSSMLQAPMTGIFLIIEITGGFDVLVSVVLVSVISATISHMFQPYSIYHQELIERGELFRPRTDARVLSELNVMELLERDCHIIHPQMKLKDLIHVIEHSHRNYYPVEDPESKKFLGIVYLDDIRPLLFNTALYESVVVEEIMNQDLETVSPDEELNKVLDKFDETGAWSLPVVHGGRFLGLISKATLLDHYRKELLAQEQD
jgi:CIC family chloride channel protein